MLWPGKLLDDSDGFPANRAVMVTKIAAHCLRSPLAATISIDVHWKFRLRGSLAQRWDCVQPKLF
jgi:hypothetical protein